MSQFTKYIPISKELLDDDIYDKWHTVRTKQPGIKPFIKRLLNRGGWEYRKHYIKPFMDYVLERMNNDSKKF